MRDRLFAVALLAFVPAVSSADNVGQCGWGSKLMEGNKGIAPQVLAVTTNGTFGNQTFAISSGTSGCTQDGVVTSSWKTVLFIEENRNKLARDMSSGSGEALDSLAALIGVEQQDQDLFRTAAKDGFGRIFSRSDVSSGEVLASLRTVLAERPALEKYSRNI